MKRRLPSLNALRAFEAAARHGSFVEAAEELAVTPAAVSHQIKGLEEALGIAMFVRHHRAVELTAAGRRLLPGLSDAFDRIATAVDGVRPAREAPVTITVPPAFAAKWLAPRLEGFMAQYPDIPIRVQAEAAVVDLEAAEVDLGVRTITSPEAAPDNKADRLFEDWVFPVCGPLLRMVLKAPANLTMQTVIVDELNETQGGYVTWSHWLEAAGAATLKPAKELRFSHSTLALDAAARGQGVALARGSLVLNEMRSGALVRPFDTAIPAGKSYHLVRSRSVPLRPKAQLFYDWLIHEAGVFREENPKLVR